MALEFLRSRFYSLYRKYSLNRADIGTGWVGKVPPCLRGKALKFKNADFMPRVLKGFPCSDCRENLHGPSSEHSSDGTFFKFLESDPYRRPELRIRSGVPIYVIGGIH